MFVRPSDRIKRQKRFLSINLSIQRLLLLQSTQTTIETLPGIVSSLLYFDRISSRYPFLPSIRTTRTTVWYLIGLLWHSTRFLFESSRFFLSIILTSFLVSWSSTSFQRLDHFGTLTAPLFSFLFTSLVCFSRLRLEVKN